MCQVTNFTKTCKMWHFTNFTKSDNKHEMCQVTNLYKVWNVNMLQTLHTTWQICTKCELCKVCMHEHDNKHEMSTCYKLYKKCQHVTWHDMTWKLYKNTKCVKLQKLSTCMKTCKMLSWIPAVCQKLAKRCKVCNVCNVYKNM